MSVSWGQIVESVGENTNIVNDLKSYFSDDKYNSGSKDLAISDASDWNNLANICNRHCNSNIKNAIETVRIVGDISFEGTNGNITIDTIPLGITLSSDVTLGSGIHTISKTTKPLINVLEGTLKYVSLEEASCTINEAKQCYAYEFENSPGWYRYNYSPLVVVNNGIIEGCKVSSSSITIDESFEGGLSIQDNERQYIAIGAVAGYNNGTINSCITEDNQIVGLDKNTGHYRYLGFVAAEMTEKGIIKNCYSQISNVDYLYGADMKNDDNNSNIISNFGILSVSNSGELTNNVIAYVANSEYVSFENAKCIYNYSTQTKVISLAPIKNGNMVQYTSGIDLQKEVNKFLNRDGNILIKSDYTDIYIDGEIGKFCPPAIIPQATKYKEPESEVFSISSADEWNDFADRYQYIGIDPVIEIIQLTADLTFEDKITSLNIPKNVTLDGNGYKITGKALASTEKNNCIPFVNENNGIIQNFFIDGFEMNVRAGDYCSMLCGVNTGVIQHCGVQKSKIVIENVDGSGLDANVGFIVVTNKGQINHCYGACNEIEMSGSETSSPVAISQVAINSEEGTIEESFAVDRYYSSSSNISRRPLCGTDFIFGDIPKKNAIFLIDNSGDENPSAKFYTELNPNEYIYQYTCSENNINPNNASSVKLYATIDKLKKHIKDYADNNNWVVNGKSMFYNAGTGGMAYNPYQKYSVKIDDTDVDFPSLDLKGTIVSDENNNRLIRSAEDWMALCTADRADFLMASSGKVILMNDIELNAEEFKYTFNDLGKYCNEGETFTFEGNGHTITLSPKYENNIAVLYPLFDEIFPKATVRNLKVIVNNAMGDYNELSTDNIYYGLLANTNNGTIESCAVLTQEIFLFSARYSYTSNDATPNVYIGVMVGENKGTIKESFVANPYGYFEVSVSCVYNDSSTGGKTDLDRKLYVGGIVGKNSGSILDSYVKMAGISIKLEENGTDITSEVNETQNYISVISGQDGENATYERVFYNNDFEMDYPSESSPDPKPEVKKMYDSKGTENPEYGDNLYGEKDEYRPYCYDLPTFIANFSNPMKWTYLKKGDMLTDEDVSNWPYMSYDVYNAPILTFSNLDAVIDEEIKVVDLILTDTTEVAEFTEALKNNPEVYSNAIVTLGNDIDYSNDEADADVPETLPFFNQLGGGDAPFNGVFDGAGYAIANFAVQADSAGSGGFFKNVSDTAVVKNLNIENAVLVVTNADSLLTYSNGEDIGEQKDTIYIAVFADKNGGKLKNCSFAGRIKVDESILNSGKEVKVCFTGENTSDTVAVDHAFIYLFDDEKPAVDEGNKVCIVIKQHIGSGRKSGRTRKTCSNKRTNKALVIPDRDTNDENASVANSEYREFTDEEFASGTVAYWLNYTQKGYTGEYSGEWTQGELYPVLDLDKKAPLVKLVYNITGTDDTEQFNGSTPFVNVGSIATLNYLQKPSSIKVNGVEVTTTMGATSAQFEVSGIDATTTPTVTVDVIYTVETGVADVAGETKEIVTKGDKVVVYGAAGERMTIVSLRGEEILSREIDSDVVTVVVPVSGIYMVEVGDMTKKVIIR